MVASVGGMALPKRAVVLAAGFGTRLRPFTCSCPKPLVPVWGCSLLEHHLRMLGRWGVEEICINLHQGGDAVREAVARMSGIPGVVFSEEREILGTGGALRPIRAWLGDSPFWMVNADIAAELEPDALVAAMVDTNAVAALWVTKQRGPRTVEVVDGAVMNLRRSRPGGAECATFCGLQLLRPEIVDFLPEAAFCSIVDAYESAMSAGRRVAAVEPERAYWQDAGTLARCLSLHAEVREAHSRGEAGGGLYDPACDFGGGEGIVSRGRGVTVGEGAVLENCILLDGVCVEAGARVTGAMVAGGCRVAGDVEGLVGRAQDVELPWMADVVVALGTSVDGCVVQGLGARGSDREFWRVASSDRSLIVCSWSDARAENFRYAGHTGLLGEAGIHVPSVVCEPCEQVLALQDLGSLSLERLMGEDAEAAHALYPQVIDEVVRLHTTATELVVSRGTELEPCFDAELWRWEHELFAEHFLTGYLHWCAADIAECREELARVAAVLAGLPVVLLHRDLQSSNVLVGDGRVWLIDFQGMRMGPAAYDLASLLCDPYVSLGAQRRADLLRQYAQNTGRKIDGEFSWAAVQRICQALGAFGRLSKISGMARYSGYIAPAGRVLGEALGALPDMPLLARASMQAVAG